MSDSSGRSIQDILDNAGELAQRFESYEPKDTDERPVETYLSERAARHAEHLRKLNNSNRDR